MTDKAVDFSTTYEKQDRLDKGIAEAKELARKLLEQLKAQNG